MVESSRYSTSAVLLVFLVPALGGLLFGFDIGGTNYALLSLVDPALANTAWSDTVLQSAAWQGSIVSAASFGALVSSSLVFLTGLGDAVGRKRELQIGSILYLLGGLVESLAIRATNGLLILLTGRIIFGLGIGITMHAAPTYLGEMGPTHIRGLLVSLKEASIVTGILVGYIVGNAFSDVDAGWCYIYATSMLGSVLMLGFSFLIPPSSRWLILKRRDDEALDALRFVYPIDAEREFRFMKELYESSQVADCCLERGSVSSYQSTAASSSNNKTHGRDVKSIFGPVYWAPLVAGVGLVILQQVTGQPSVLSYASRIFQAAGLSKYSAILVALWKLCGTIFAALVVEKFGRKRLLYAGCSLMLVALLTLSLVIDGHYSSNGALVIIAMLAYIGGYQIGFGPISWLMISEIFPLEVRGQAVAFAVQMNFLLNTIVQFGVAVLEETVGLGRTFAMFALATAYRYVFPRK